MKRISKICNGIDTINDQLGKVFSLLVAGILGVVMIEVVLRRLFSRPQIWTQDMIVMLFACYVILISAYGFLNKAFVAVDILFARLNKKSQYILHLVTYLIFFIPFTFAMLPASWRFFYKAWAAGEKSYSVWAPVVWPEKLCFFIGLLLLSVQGISEILKQIIGISESLKEERTSKIKKLEEKEENT